MAIFRTFFFFGNKGKGNVFYDILERKIASQGYKNMKFKTSKKWHFSKEVNPYMVLVQKWPFFQFFFSGNIGQEKVSYDILNQKNVFLGFKNRKFKQSKNWHFFKRVNPWYWSKFGHFCNFFFSLYRPGKCLLRYSRTK